MRGRQANEDKKGRGCKLGSAGGNGRKKNTVTWLQNIARGGVGGREGGGAERGCVHGSRTWTMSNEDKEIGGIGTEGRRTTRQK